uniref:Uncharacterized protein n=1 Tax=Rhizophora mucronata TaxID=61149 RepID=A0A2P2PF26_RHIMU
MCNSHSQELLILTQLNFSMMQ